MQKNYKQKLFQPEELYRKIMAVCPQLHTKIHKYTVWAERSVMLRLQCGYHNFI
jgi:Zn ribbon nucleic-acid-binding protein